MAKKSRSTNTSLNKARTARNDEFYTCLTDIERECKHYEEQFHGKTILCNCDDPQVSNFFRFFFTSFHRLGLKRIISVCRKSKGGQGMYCVYDGKERTDGIIEDGDFRSPASIELLKQADIVCTNPPFSLFREYTAQLMTYRKEFLIIGNDNAITYKEIFPLIKENKLWRGYERVKQFITDKNEIKKFGNVGWYTNLDVSYRHEEMFLRKRYSPDKYPKYDNYDAIEVSKLADIPCDWGGCMGVPITFIEKYNPKQFEIIWTTDRGGDGMLDWLKKPYHLGYGSGYVNNVKLYKRIIIRRRI
ncbi:MAG: adenine-specific methyltransferase EcoRI family protein [Planctomycetaceae bacterium]|nr:adenine-specific methyltransferase EcoRI family protein [Planctomycetaceae bacterium]